MAHGGVETYGVVAGVVVVIGVYGIFGGYDAWDMCAFVAFTFAIAGKKRRGGSPDAFSNTSRNKGWVTGRSSSRGEGEAAFRPSFVPKGVSAFPKHDGKSRRLATRTKWLRLRKRALSP